MKKSERSLKLNLGCGYDHREGWVNVDVDPAVQPDLIHDLYQPLPFADGSVAAIHAQDILEHFTHEDGQRVIADISRVLKEGGILTVRVPNVDDILERFADKPEVRNLFLYGDTSASGVFGAHKVGFTPETLLVHMMSVDLYPVKLEKIETNLAAEFIKEKQPLALQSLTFFSQTFSFGGAEVFATDLLTELRRRSVKINVINSSPHFVQTFHQRKISARQISFFADVIGDWKGFIKTVWRLPLSIWQTIQVVREAQKTDLLLLSGFTEKLVVTPWAWLLNVPIVWIEFGPLEQVFQKFGRLPQILYRLCKDLPNAIIMPSKNTRNHLISTARINLAKVRVIPCGRDISPRKNIKLQPNTIACVSRLEPGKGHDVVIAAMKKVLKKIPRAQLLITGKSVMLPELEAQVRQFYLEKHVKFLGQVDDALDILAKSQVCVFPSLWELEGFGLVTIEAMALGKPVVAFATGPTPEIIRHGVNGLLAEPGNVDQLADHLITLLQQPSLAKKLGGQAHQDFQHRYTIKSVADQYQTTFTEVLLRKRAKAWLRANT